MEHKETATLETERLLLRRFIPDDADAVYRNWGSDIEVARFLGEGPQASVEAAKKEIVRMTDYDDRTYRWAIVPKDLGQPVGVISAYNVDDLRRSLEIGYTLGSRWWHRRIMSEALGAAIRFFFTEIKANRISAKHNATNPRSGGVLLNAGMQKEGTLRQASKTGCDVICYAILAEDYFGNV